MRPIGLQKRGLPLQGAQQQRLQACLLRDDPRFGEPRQLAGQFSAPCGQGGDRHQRTRLRG